MNKAKILITKERTKERKKEIEGLERPAGT